MIQYARAIGANTDTETAQSFIFPKVIPEDLEGQIIVTCLISGIGEDVFTRIRQSGPVIEEQFFSSQEVIPIRFEKVIAEIEQALAGVEHLQILLAAIKDDILYVVSKGDHQVYLKRVNKLIPLVEKDLNGQLISGHIQPGDKILFLSTQNPTKEGEFEDYSKKSIERLVSTSIDSFEEDVTFFHQEHAYKHPIAAILIHQTLPELMPQMSTIPNLDDQFQSLKHFKFPNLLSILYKGIRVLQPRSKKAVVAILGIVLILALSGAGYWYLTKGVREKMKQEQLTLNQARGKLEEAKSLKDVDFQKAQVALTQAKNLVNEVLAKDSKNSEAKEVKKLIEENKDLIMKVYPITDWPIFLSLDLIKKDFQISRMSFSLKKVLLLDETQKTLVIVDLNKKTNQILAGASQLGDAKIASLNGTQAFVYSQDKGILRLDAENQKISTVAKPDPEWGKISDIVGFASNVYLLDSLKNQIWKYVPTQTRYSDKNSYLKDNPNVDFSNAKRMQIDYSVWVLKSGPEILKFTGGNNDYFGIVGLDTNLQEITNLYVSEEGDNAYFLEPENSRLVVFKKNGEYQYQLKGDKFKTASDFVVDEEEKKVYLLDKNKIYQIELKSN